MARIRTIKPDFWSDDAVAQLSPTAMLLFIGMWNFADDEGYMRDSVGQLRRQIFPDRGWDVESALAELLILGRVARMESAQGALLHVPHLQEHQKISHPTPTKFTQIRPVGSPIPENSGTLRKPREPSGLKEGRKEGRDEEGKGGAVGATPLVDNSEPPIRCTRHVLDRNPGPCGACKDARLAHEQWAALQAVTGTPPRAVRHIDGLCDEHRQKEAECIMCQQEGVGLWAAS